MVNEKRVHNHLANIDLCPLCGTLRESVIHALRDCLVVRPVWLVVLPNGVRLSFFSMDLHAWILWNMRGGLQGWDKDAWIQRFAISVWCIWRMRNDVVFNHVQWDIAQIHGWINSSFHDDRMAFLDDETSPTSSSSTSWLFPAIGWIKINIDGSVWNNGEAECGGGMVLNSSGSWL